MTAPASPLLELQDVRLAFQREEVLRGVDLRLNARERLIVLGQSGGGKSTLLRLILGILRPSRGSLRFKGLEITRMGRRRLNRMRQRVGMVYQNSALISSLNVRDNLALPLEELTDMTPQEIDEVVMHKLQLVGMEDTREKMPSELSGGMRKRIALARGIIMDPELILYDEPSAGLDPVTSTLIDQLIISLSEKIGATSIVVTHEMESAFRVATRMAMLYQGKIIADDKPEVFKHHPNPVVAQFISGDPHGPLGDHLPEELA
ncbi:MAG TPA: ATP-binding cassette domain-containing protein [Chthoniobacter sp.]|jgi:phospholipid/cholesterol/gamma-HCH transport system ATP-binding protein